MVSLLDGGASPVLDEPLLVGNYELFRVLGEGGVATTYLGRDLRRGQLVAVKALHLLRSKNRPLIELFEREAEALRGIRHNQIPTFHETMVAEGPETLTLYLVQQFMEGRSLYQLMAGGHRFTAPQVVAVLLSCLSPLEYLHGLQPPLFHRDIKPSNIIIGPDGGSVLVDFGAVREALADPKVAGSSVVGTFGYMAPEQFQARVGPASDLYALGATALHLLSGRTPTDFPVRRLKPDFHATLDADPHLLAIIDLLLEPVAEDRYQSTHSLRRALERWVTDHPEAYDEALQQLRALPGLGSIPLATQRAMPAGPASRLPAAERAVIQSPIISLDEDASPLVEEPAPAPGRAGATTQGFPPPVAAGGEAAESTVKLHPREMPALSAGLVRRAAEARAQGSMPAIRRTADSLVRLFNPVAEGYSGMGPAWLAVAALVAVLVRARPALAPGGWAVAGVLGAYGLIYLGATLARRAAKKPRGLAGWTDGQLRAIELRTTALGEQKVVLVYEFHVNGQSWTGTEVFSSRHAAQPFLRRELRKMVRYDYFNPRRNGLGLQAL